MSRHKFIVVKLQEWKVPAVMVGVAALCFASYVQITENKASSANAVEAFSPLYTYEDGVYIANLAFANANMNLVVNVVDEVIVSVSLEDFDESERLLYSDLNNSIAFVNNYVVSTQSIEITDQNTISTATSILMDGVAVALSKQREATLNTTYQSPLLEMPLSAE
ncbi:hypothetical protein [Candidatus Epulonipiscium viviparus]|uniref:hypothetical protein n=1 Tax=Candidatus Epulonipiscium viviparus TaxID=420336 RepID=UPI0027381319|nr:hypothetical protein [Candidatus Epulopiscium viviparus]